MRIFIVFLLFIGSISCDSKKEAKFVIKNKGLDSMIDTHIIVHIDTVMSYKSKKIDVPGKSQSMIIVKIPNKPYHQGYEFSYSRNGKEIRENQSHWTTETPSSESFMIEQLMDTLWYKTFHIN